VNGERAKRGESAGHFVTRPRDFGVRLTANLPFSDPFVGTLPLRASIFSQIRGHSRGIRPYNWLSGHDIGGPEQMGLWWFDRPGAWPAEPAPHWGRLRRCNADSRSDGLDGNVVGAHRKAPSPLGSAGALHT